MTFAEVILPLPLSTTFTYAVPPEMAPRVKPGHRVIVPFGRRKYYTGIVASVTPVAPQGYEIKDIAMAIDEAPVLRHPQLKLWGWVSDYYMASIGDVFNAAMPAGLKLESETFIEIAPDYTESPGSPLTERESIILQLLDHEEKRLRIIDIEKKTGLKRVSAAIASMLDKGAVIVSERLVERYRSRKEVCVKPSFADTEGRRAAFEAVKGAPKQERALLALMELCGMARGESREVTRKQLMERAEVTSAIVAAMEKKGLVESYVKIINRFRYSGLVEGRLPQLTEIQDKALREIHMSWMDHGVTLLRGVTSSGKTEIYIHLIDYVMKQGRQVLMLVPEIALTTQLSDRLQKVFGSKVMIYHSKFSDNERVDLWRRLLEMRGEPCVVLGARSAVFLPFDHLGLVIVDEEHDSSYKQAEPAPRYNGRDTAIVLASMHGAKTLLGSATPAVETYYKARNGKYGLVELLQRYENRQLPSIELIDLKEQRNKGALGGSLSAPARRYVSDAIASGSQAIIFLNRRGYAPMAVCKTCGYVPRCEHCDVSLTYHRYQDRLICHYCGASYPLPSACPACHEHTVEIVGYGTERIEEELELSFPEIPIARMDLDTTRNKEGYSRIIDEFSNGKSKLLVGTQMVTKGLDFGNVSVVVVVNADAVLHYPDYRSTERAFDMISQVAGRAGRRADGAVVAVQTYDPANPVFPFIVNHDYTGFYEREIAERAEFLYPPAVRLIYIYFKHSERETLSEIASIYARELRALLGDRVSGPDEPPVARVQSLYIRRIMLKIEPEASLPKLRKLLHELQERMYAYPGMRTARMYYDVDPA